MLSVRAVHRLAHLRACGACTRMRTSLAFSLIMETAEAVRVPRMRGNTEASTRRSRSTPRTRKSPSRTAIGLRSGPIGRVQEAR